MVKGLCPKKGTRVLTTSIITKYMSNSFEDTIKSFLGKPPPELETKWVSVDLKVILSIKKSL